MKRKIAAALIGVVALGGLAAPISGCGNPEHFSKTKFALHSGLAFGAFHRYIYKPFKAGDFKDPGSHKAEVVKAGLAGAFAYHEIKLAIEAAKADPTLSKLVPDLGNLGSQLSALSTALKAGSRANLGIDSVNNAISNITSQSSKSGTEIKDQFAPIPGG